MTARVRTVVDCDFALDGGAMMGVVPRPLWEKAHPADARHRIPMVSRFVLAEDRPDGRLWLLDAGLGRDWTPKLADIYALRPRGGDLRARVAAAGFDPDDVTDVLLTHLHFDHAGGVVRRDPAGGAALAFPRARHHLQAAHWAWARAPSAKDAGSFRPDPLALLEAAGGPALADGPARLGRSVSVRTVHGHTPGMQLPLLETDAGPLLFLADLVPLWSHLRLPWIMAYDNQPLLTLQEKRGLLGEAARSGWTLLSEHDAAAPRATLTETAPGVFEGRPFSTDDDR